MVLAAHGAPPSDYPRMRVGLLMMLEYAPKRTRRLFFLRSWHDRLVREVVNWPRTRASDPYKAAVDDLVLGLSSRLGLPVFAGYNEFCAPTVGEAIDLAVGDGAERVFVVPTMLLRGNSHTESEIHGAVLEAGRRHPQTRIEYAWPFSDEHLVALFAGQVTSCLGRAAAQCGASAGDAESGGRPGDAESELA